MAFGPAVLKDSDSRRSTSSVHFHDTLLGIQGVTLGTAPEVKDDRLYMSQD